MTSIENLVQKTLDRFGPPDILVNNASISKKRAFTVDYDDNVWQEVMRSNLFGTYLTTNYFLKPMFPRKIDSSNGLGYRKHPMERHLSNPRFDPKEFFE